MVPARQLKSTCQCKREQHAKWKLDSIQTAERTASLGILWRDRTSGKAIYRRIVLGATDKFVNEDGARAAAAGIVLEINLPDPRLERGALTVSQLAEHYRFRELSVDNTWKTYSTKKSYENYFKRWIIPKWGDCALNEIKPVLVELWLRQLPLARATCAKIRNIMSALFNHAGRYDLFDENPFTLFVRVPSGARHRMFSESMKLCGF